LNSIPNKAWSSLSEDELAALDLRQFLGGRSPHGGRDSSIDTAFRLGKAAMTEIVQHRVGFTGGRVLDLLSGFGRWLPFLAEANREVVAIERVADATTLARNMCEHFGISNVMHMTGDISRIRELDRGSFDFVWMWSGLQYVERAHALTQIHRVLKPGGRVFIAAYNATGLMVEHVVNGAETGMVFDGASQWALSALARGREHDGNPNFMDLDGCEDLCKKFGFSLIAAAPQSFLDLRAPEGRASGWQDARRVGRYFRTVEFLAERSATAGKAAARGLPTRLDVRRWLRPWIG
jgi:SAM-dependent methyltransferase